VGGVHCLQPRGPSVGILKDDEAAPKDIGISHQCTEPPDIYREVSQYWL